MGEPTIIHLVRHGRTTLNAEGRFRGRQDPPLDEEGRAQAARAAAALAGWGIVAVYASPLLRARQTAEPIAAAAGVAVANHEGLIDLDYGRFEGLTKEEAARLDADALAELLERPRVARPPGGEALADVERRVSEALAGIAGRHPGQTVTAVSHELPIKLTVGRLLGVDGPELWSLDVPTGSVSTLRAAGGTLALA